MNVLLMNEFIIYCILGKAFVWSVINACVCVSFVFILKYYEWNGNNLSSGST